MNQGLGGGAWRRTALPGEIGVGGERGSEGTEDEPVREGGGNESVDADCRAESRVHEMRRIIEQVVGRDDVQLREGLPEPAGEEVPDEALARGDEGTVLEILRGDGILAGERVVRAEEESPSVRLGKLQVVVVLVAPRADEEREVDRAVRESTGEVLAIAGDDAEVEFRMRGLEGRQRGGKASEGRDLAGADDERSREAA